MVSSATPAHPTAVDICVAGIPGVLVRQRVSVCQHHLPLLSSSSPSLSHSPTSSPFQDTPCKHRHVTLVPQIKICMSQQLGNEVERQGKAKKSTTPRTALSFQRKEEELPWRTHDTLQSRRALTRIYKLKSWLGILALKSLLENCSYPLSALPSSLSFFLRLSSFLPPKTFSLVCVLKLDFCCSYRCGLATISVGIPHKCWELQQIVAHASV